MRSGFVAGAVAFYTELEADNSRAFWSAHRDRYDGLLRPAFLDILTGLGGEWRVYRPHNDVRYARTPYKTFLGAVTEWSDGVGTFVRVGPRGLLVATGIPQPAPDQLARLRAGIAAGGSGTGFASAVERVEARGARVHGGRWDPLVRVPRGYPADHPRGIWLRWKGVEIAHHAGAPPWLDSTEAPARIRGLVDRGTPLHRWLATHVGPSALTPEERFAPRRSSAST